MKPVRVLVVGMTATVGGIENFLVNYLSRIDKSRVQFDFLTRFADAAYPEARAAIGRTYVIPRRSESPVRFYREISDFFAAHHGEYDVVWDNECMFNDMTPLKLAAEYGVPVRIAHSHNPENMDVSLRGRGQELLHRVQRRRLSRYANVLWACSEESARWACPAMDLAPAVIPNAIDAAAFRFNAEIRREVRAQYGLEDCLVVGHVGRLQYQKNQAFLLEAFARLHTAEPRARLVIAGDGPELAALEARAVSLGVAQAVLFLGARDDVPRLLQAFDLFVMPSRFEGLGMAALEAQAAGLPCLLSAAVPKAAAVTPACAFLPAEDAEAWAARMLEMLREAEKCGRPDNTELLAQAGYDIARAAERLTGRFEQLVKRERRFQRRFLLTVRSGAKGVPAMNKARDDVRRFAAENGYAPVKITAGDSARGVWWKQALLTARVLWDWTSLFFRLRYRDILLVQYPYFPVKAAPIARFGLHMLKWKGVETAALVHDLDSLRLIGGDGARWSDQVLLPSFDRIICHNGRMQAYLASQGVPRGKLTPLTLFDYHTEAPMPERERSLSVCVAGNLSREKSGYLYALPRTKLVWHLYGGGWKGKKRRTDVISHGEVAPEKLPGVLEGAFGLVWDGPSTERCSGAYGAYLMLNDPHKMSLYLAAGMPVVVWACSAQADLVRAEGAGLVIERLGELPAAIAAVPPEAYAEMAGNARRLGEKLRCGVYLTRALAGMEKPDAR
ncbi:MAG: glycosyltransferase [Clostridia bacterium]|nr:glycosyltransferase [Clostridia bacterium]